MKKKIKKTKQNVVKAIETLIALSDLLNETISDLHEVKGCAETRHSLILYRSRVWKALEELQ